MQQQVIIQFRIVCYRCTFFYSCLYFSLQEAESVGTLFDTRDNAVFTPLRCYFLLTKWLREGGIGEWSDFANEIIYFSNKSLKKTNKYISQKYFIYWQENCCQGVSPVWLLR